MRRRARQLAIYATLGAAVVTLAASLVATGPGFADRDSRNAGDPEYESDPAVRHLAWIDRAGRMTAIATPPRGYVYPRLSPDGRSAALDIRDGRHGLWLWRIGSATLTPLSVGRASDIAPVWSHTGDWLLFSRGRGPAPGLFALFPASGRIAALPGDSNSLLLPSAFVPGDRRVLVTVSVATGFDIFAVDLHGDGTPVAVIANAADDVNPDVSPDGRWVAYQSRASGQFEIWLRSLVGGEARQLTVDGGTRPAWTRGGREIVYLTDAGTMMAMSVAGTDGEKPRVGAPQPLFTADVYRDLVGRTFDVTADGGRFLVIVAPAALRPFAAGQASNGRAWH